MKTQKRKTGDLGEEIAETYLKKRGYIILGRNYNKKWGELDIVAKFKKDIIFIEVKSVAKGGIFLPAHNVNFHKQQRLIRAARSWLAENKISAEINWRIDVVVVELNYEKKKAKVEHLRNAVRSTTY
jgi:putative endonuclease